MSLEVDGPLLDSAVQVRLQHPCKTVVAVGVVVAVAAAVEEVVIGVVPVGVAVTDRLGSMFPEGARYWIPAGSPVHFLWGQRGVVEVEIVGRSVDLKVDFAHHPGRRGD
jgi:hypothetical protein